MLEDGSEVHVVRNKNGSKINSKVVNGEMALAGIKMSEIDWFAGPNVPQSVEGNVSCVM